MPRDDRVGLGDELAERDVLPALRRLPADESDLAAVAVGRPVAHPIEDSRRAGPQEPFLEAAELLHEGVLAPSVESLQDRNPGALRVDPALQDAAPNPAPELFRREARVEEHRDVAVEPRGAQLLLGTGDGEDVVDLVETPPHGGELRLEILEGDPDDGLRCRQRPLLDASDEDVPRRRESGERPLKEVAFRDSGCGFSPTLYDSTG
ncbi:MAG: hypothetical protein HY900_30950 [Deltaproteobacteria bacterium]|nr:hypothetical protein [Deltaproteobacteria bacterium]